MKSLKKWIAGGILATTLASSAGLSAQYYTGGYGYQQSRTAPALAPAIALGAIALAAIIAVAVQNSENSHGHCGSN